MPDKVLFVKSHVSRDLLQNAALFKTDKLVVWEYVSNGLQYVDPGTSPTVHVLLDSKNKRISIADNGRGMTVAGLENFFVMHGENIDRKAGVPGRGRFGTGKSAAFGIADSLRVTSVRDNRRSSVELTRADLNSASSGEPVPVKVLESEVVCSEQNGTRIEINAVHLRSLDQPGIIRYIERHLARWPRNCLVYVNHHECQYSEPPIEQERLFKPTGKAREVLGDVQLVVKIARAPLEEDLRGISIYSTGTWHETTLCGGENKEMANYIFGEIDVPALERDQSPIQPFDLGRSMRLNPNNEIVRMIYAFVGQSTEQIRKELVEREHARRRTEESQRLAKEASEIAKLLNEDFDAFRDKVNSIRTKINGIVDKKDILADPAEGLDPGNFVPAIEIPTGGLGAIGNGGEHGEVPRSLLSSLQRADAGDKIGQEPSKINSRAKARGGFTVQFEQMGAEEHRALYLAEQRAIYINLDHPQLAAARGTGSTSDPTFKRLAYEVAFTEYAIAISSELGKRGEFSDWSDPIYEVRETINRLARKGSHLYQA